MYFYFRAKSIWELRTQNAVSPRAEVLCIFVGKEFGGILRVDWIAAAKVSTHVGKQVTTGAVTGVACTECEKRYK